MNHSGKGQGTSTEVVPEDLKEDGMTSASQCVPIFICSKEEDLSKGVCEQNPKYIVSHLRTASRSVGEEVVGSRIKVWWPLDQKFYKGTIMGFDHENNTHQVDNDDGEIEILDLTTECWKLLKKHENGPGAAPSSSKAKNSSRSVGEEVVGRRIKVWWPLDQKFYRGTIAGIKMHQVDYDDGEIEILDLTAEDWKLLKKKETGAAPSSSKAD